MQPPLLPEETFTRVYRLARIDGTGVLAIAGAFALAAGFVGDRMGVTIGLLVAGAGAVELHGAQLLRDGETRAMGWLITSQFYLLAVVLAYCAWRLLNFDPAFVDTVLTPEMRAGFLQAGYAPGELHELVRRIYYATYSVVAVVTLLYQGGMALFYSRRRAPVAKAIAAMEVEE
ncbi:MAG: hypothetical protein ACHQ4G_08785 [Opitutales bacterium]